MWKSESCRKLMYGIEFKKIGANNIWINIHKHYPGLYYDENDFLKKSKIKIEVFDSDIGIINYKNSKYLFYDANQKESKIGPDVESPDYFIQNTDYYFIRCLICRHSLAIHSKIV